MDALPREIIAAAQLKNQRDTVENPSESLLNLKGTIPDSVLHCLAPFQRDAVLFVLRNKGRALIADEMGLGTVQYSTVAYGQTLSHVYVNNNDIIYIYLK